MNLDEALNDGHHHHYHMMMVIIIIIANKIVIIIMTIIALPEYREKDDCIDGVDFCL